MPSGIIYLMSMDGVIVDEKKYLDRSERRNIIKAWKFKCGRSFSGKYFIQIAPKCKDRLVHRVTGENVRFKNNYEDQQTPVEK